MTPDPDRELELALLDAEAHAEALAWRHLCATLEGPLRVLVASSDEASLRRARALLREKGFETHGWWAQEGAPRLGVVEQLRASHAWIWVTSWTAALSTSERDLLELARQQGAPLAFGLALDGGHLLERMSDDPERERQEVLERLAALEPGPALDLGEADLWLAGWSPIQAQLGATQRQQVGARVRAEVAARLSAEIARRERDFAQTCGQIAALEQAIQQDRQRAQRVVNHLTASVRRHTAQLLIDLRDWLIALEADLPAQVASVQDTEVLRRALPHWLQHILEQNLVDRLAAWRAAVLADLQELELDASTAPAAELLIPALHPGPLEAEADWTRRLGTTAALGGAAAFFAFGQWAPGLVLLGAGLAFSSVRRGASEAQSRDRLRQTAEQALRALAADAPASLDAQQAELLRALAAWPAQVEAQARQQQAPAAALLLQAKEEDHRTLQRLRERLARLGPEGPARRP